MANENGLFLWISQSETKSNLEKSHPDSVLPKIEEINFETISMIFKDTIRLSMSDVNNEIQKGFAGRNDSSSAKGYAWPFFDGLTLLG